MRERGYPPLLRRVSHETEPSPDVGFSAEESPTVSLSKPVLRLLAQGTAPLNPEVSIALPDPNPDPEPEAAVILQIPDSERAPALERNRDTRPPARPRLVRIAPENDVQRSGVRPLLWLSALVIACALMGAFFWTNAREAPAAAAATAP